jgi:hypothetical protein
VLREGIAEVDEIPEAYGALLARGEPDALRFEVLRAAPKRAMRLPFAAWMALARATPRAAVDCDDAQRALGEPGEDHSAGSGQ